MPAIPKPTREDRRRRCSDVRGLAYPKAVPVRDDDYRAWIRAQGRCLLARFERPCGSIGGRAVIEAAHLISGGMATKGSDASCIPLCPIHHDALDGETLPWQIVAYLWMNAWSLREEWNAREVVSMR
jgi:hypothetical protein